MVKSPARHHTHKTADVKGLFNADFSTDRHLPRDRAQEGRSVNRMVAGIEHRRAPSSLVDEGGKARAVHGRSEGEHLEGQRIGANDRARGARLAYGGTRGTEALRVLRRARIGGYQRLHGDARY